MVWKFIDLSNASIEKPLTLFLFGSAFDSWSKELEGSIMCILHPEPLDSKDDESAYKVTSEDQLQKLGMSASFGTCKGTRKDGQPCTMSINRDISSYCNYHAPIALRNLKQQQKQQQKPSSIIINSSQQSSASQPTLPSMIASLRSTTASISNNNNNIINNNESTRSKLQQFRTTSSAPTSNATVVVDVKKYKN